MGKRGNQTMGYPAPSQRLPVLILAGDSASKWRHIEACAARAGGVTVVRYQGTSEGLREICQRLRPIVLVADVECVRLLLGAQETSEGNAMAGVRILVHGVEFGDSCVESWLRQGCWGVLSPRCSARQLWKAVEAVAAGQYWVGRRVLTQIARKYILAQSVGLTARETEILQLVAQGCKNQEIARRLFISVETVRWHLRGLYNKLGVHDRLAAAMQAAGLLETISARQPQQGQLAPTGTT
ncbi:MAG: response regulator transcription factor [Bryobacteraceae bacterium]